ncbi:FecR domain-containing protein [Sphaerotilus sp.]|uniref:FecR domain-containing protein n=1 Tax=Sphaerotilus sp. TaxID=2093942 RepID=UPI002ACDFC43|nr:FecR domain-containing protein [Sphaerotilus sp.]MDZ7855855.1 FecR domain-containing protein [Sphaerotilus sp.]
MAAESAAHDNEPALLRAAAEWFALLHDEDASDADRARWREWLAADAAHARVWERVRAISQPFADAAEAAPAQALRDTLTRAQDAGRRRALRLLSLGGLVAGVGLLARQALPWPGWLHELAMARADHRTAAGEQRHLSLPDGTRLALNTATAVDVDFGRALRRIVLHDGEILVETAPDTQSPARALVVDTAFARLTALGTRFAVRGNAGGGHVAVFQGSVRVALSGGVSGVESGVDSLEVPAGRQARFSADGITADGHADTAREAWSRGQLVADDVPLAAFVAELSRYTTVPITISPAAAPLRLVGVYPIANPGRDVPLVLAALESALPVRVQRTPAGGVHIGLR